MASDRCASSSPSSKAHSTRKTCAPTCAPSWTTRMETAGSSETQTLERPATRKPGPPLWLLAELTYRCPLHCAYCSNPVDYATHGAELDTRQWFKVLEQARELGAVQRGLSGGEPMLRDDLEDIVAHARQLGFYS